MRSSLCNKIWIASSLSPLAMTSEASSCAHESIVDQIVQRFLHIHIRRNDAGLLQRQPRLEDRIALRRADPVEVQIGALLELNVDHRVRKLGYLFEDALLVVVVRQAIFARALVDREHAARQFGIRGQKLLAAVEDAVRVGLLVAIEQPRTVLGLRLRHHWIKPGPGIHVAANERDLAVWLLQ